MMAALKRKILLCEFWRWILFTFLIIGFCILSIQYTTFEKMGPPFLYDIILEQTNDVLSLCFMLPLAWSIIVSSHSMYSSEQSSICKTIIQVVKVNFICLLILIIVNILLCICSSGWERTFVGHWLTGNQIADMGLTPFWSCVISLALLYTRLLFISFLMLLVNKISNSNINGLIAIIILCLIDWNFYNAFQINIPLGILPIEHSRILYTEGFAPMFEGDARLPFWHTLIYWIILYGLLALIYYLNSKRNSRVRLNNER